CKLRAADVQSEKDRPVFRTDDHAHAIVLLQALYVLNRHVLNEVDVTRKQGLNAPLIRLNGKVDQFGNFERDLASAPVHVIAAQDRFLAGLATDEHEGAGAVGIERRKALLAFFKILNFSDAMLLSPSLAHDEQVGEVCRQEGVRPLGLDLERVVVDLDQLLD